MSRRLVLYHCDLSKISDFDLELNTKTVIKDLSFTYWKWLDNDLTDHISKMFKSMWNNSILTKSLKTVLIYQDKSDKYTKQWFLQFIPEVYHTKLLFLEKRNPVVIDKKQDNNTVEIEHDQSEGEDDEGDAEEDEGDEEDEEYSEDSST